jgi:2-dehydropantoate 2-reductase
MADNPQIILVGTGAVGSFYAGKLSQAGARVSVVCRSDYDIVSRNGINIGSVWGDFHFMPEMVMRNIAEYNGEADYVIVATKVLPGIDVPGIIKAGISPKTSIMLLQNGVDIEGNIAAAFPKNEIIGGLAFICVSRSDYGEVVHQDFGRIVIGRYPSGESEKVDLISKLLIRAGVPCEKDRDVIAARWKKLVWNAPFNPISVIGGGVNTQEMLGAEPVYNLVKKVMEEVVLLSEKTGHPVPRDVIQKNLDDTLVMKPYKTSMLLDYENRRPMEVDAILGNALKIARDAGVSVPCIECLYGILYLLNKQNISRK